MFFPSPLSHYVVRKRPIRSTPSQESVGSFDVRLETLENLRTNRKQLDDFILTPKEIEYCEEGEGSLEVISPILTYLINLFDWWTSPTGERGSLHYYSNFF